MSAMSGRETAMLREGWQAHRLPAEALDGHLPPA